VTVAINFEIAAGTPLAPGTQIASGAVKVTGLGAASGAHKPVGAFGAAAGANDAPGPKVSSTSSGITAPESFRSKWQQMVAALDESADESAPAPAAGGTSQASATEDQTVSALLHGKQSIIGTNSQTLQSSDKLSTQSNLMRAVSVAQQAEGQEAQKAPITGTAVAASVTSQTKSNVADRPVLEKSQKLQPNSPSSNDAPAINPAQLFQPVQQAMTANRPLSSAAQVDTVLPSLSSNADIGAFPGKESANSGPHDSVSNPVTRVSTAQTPETERIAPGAIDQLKEAPVRNAGQTPVSHPISADHSAEKTVVSPVASPADSVSSQPAETQRGSFGVIAPRPFNTSTGSDGVVSSVPPVPATEVNQAQIAMAHAESAIAAPADEVSSPPAAPKSGSSGVIAPRPFNSLAGRDGVASPVSPVPSAEVNRPQIAAARVVAGAQSVRANSGDDAQQHSPAVEGVHGQLNGAIAGVAAVRDTAPAMPSNIGPGPAVAATSGAHTAETFTALDGAGSSMQPTWFHAGAHQAEAGFEDPALGWVSVRAGVNASGISAVVVPDSAAATQALGAHMAGLHDYLQEQRSPVESLTLAQNSGGDAGLNQSMQHQGQHQPAQDNPANAQTVGSVPHFATVTTPEQATQLTGRSDQPGASGSSGRYISVMA